MYKLRITDYILRITATDTMLKQRIQKQLNEYNIKPNRVLGQNFLIDNQFIEALIASADISKQDIVVEVGSGTGAITKNLAQDAGQVIAVEKDPNLIPILQKELKNFRNVKIINEDILNFNITSYELPACAETSAGRQVTSYKVVGAPPYYLTGRLFRHFLENQNPPTVIALIIQKEVAQKIVAKSPKSNLLAVSVQLYGNPRIIKIVPRVAFWPRPKVDSAILLVENIKKPTIDEEKFFKVLKTGFSSPRKQLETNLRQKFTIPKGIDIDLSRRAQTLSLEEWKNLAKKLQ